MWLTKWGEERVKDVRVAGRQNLCVQTTDEAGGIVGRHRTSRPYAMAGPYRVLRPGEMNGHQTASGAQIERNAQ